MALAGSAEGSTAAFRRPAEGSRWAERSVVEGMGSMDWNMLKIFIDGIFIDGTFPMDLKIRI